MLCAQCLRGLWPYASRETPWRESRERHEPPRQRNGSASGLRIVRPLSSPCSPSTCGWVHRCRLATQRQEDVSHLQSISRKVGPKVLFFSLRFLRATVMISPFHYLLHCHTFPAMTVFMDVCIPPTIRNVLGKIVLACIKARACPEWKRSKIPSA